MVGRIADRGPEYVSAREWMRICFELLELLKAHKKAIRRATVNTFGYIAKAIGETEIVMVIMYTIINYFSKTNFRPTRCIGYTA